MPLYDCYCDCGNTEERILSYDEFDKPHFCKCGKRLKFKISTFDFSMSNPITRQGKAAHGRDMALRTLNSPGSDQAGVTSRFSGDKYKKWGLAASANGLADHEKTVW